MALIALRLTTHTSLTAAQKTVIRYVTEFLELGQPARYVGPSANVWLVFDDHRLTLRDLAILGTVAANLGSWSPNPNQTVAEMRAAILAFIDANVVWPDEIDYSGSTNVWQTTLTANGAPSVVQASGGVPSGFTVEAS